MMEPEMPVSARKKSTLLEAIYDWFEVICVAAIIVVLIFTFVGRMATVKGTSMTDTLQEGDRLIVTNLFYTPDIKGDYYILSPEESKHCLRVLRMGAGDSLVLVDGQGGWYEGVIEDANAKGCGVRICRVQEHYGQRPFRMHLAIAPTKNMDRMEWMLEKCTEMGIEVITLLETAHSERKVVQR